MANPVAGPVSDELDREVVLTVNQSCIEAHSISSLKCLIDDEFYQQLQRHFLRQGRGRPCDLPQIQGVTNGLLLQLYFLKEECSASFKQLKEWLEKLLPHLGSVSESRIYQRIQLIIETCTGAAADVSTKFLQDEYCFHKLSDSLSMYGLKRYHISGAEPYELPPCNDISNEVVVDLEKLRAQEREGQSFVHQWIKRLSSSCHNLSMFQIKSKVDKCFNHYKKLSKNKNKSEQCLKELNDFLKLPFMNREISLNVPKFDKCKVCSNKNVIISKLEQSYEDVSFQLSMQLEVNASMNKENAKLAESEKDLNYANSILKKQLKCEKSKTKDYCRELDAVQKSSLYQKNYAQKRKLEEVTLERDTLLQQKEEDLAKMEETVNFLKKKLKIEQTTKSRYKLATQEHTKIATDLSDMLDKEKIKTRDEGSSHRYSDKIRQTFYALQGEGNVAASNCSTVVATVAKHLFNTNLSKDDLPSKSTALNFASEASVIAHHQVVDEILKSEHFMFGSDATSRQKAHYLEQHLNLSNGKVLSLGFCEMASDDSDTLLEKCSGMFKKLCDIYCQSNDDYDLSSLFKEIIKKLKCLMSDRASVMKCFDKKLQAFKSEVLEGEDCSTHFLFCNAHFLLALSTAAEEALGLVEKELTENGDKLGRDANPVYKSYEKNVESAASRTIRMSAECLGPRGDEKSGSRQEWLSFCFLNNKVSKFTSYRSNRFNNLFQNATALLFHKDDILMFLTGYASHSNLKLQSIVADLKDPRVVSNIAALSFFHVFFSESYWLLMNSHKSYLDFPDYVRKMDVMLTLWSSAEFDPTAVTPVFLDFQACEEDKAVINEFFLSDIYDKENFSKTLRVIVDICSKALKRQLTDFLDGGVFGGEIKEDVGMVLRTCPLTNLTGERLFGDLDYDMSKRRNASLALRSTTCMWKHNRTAKWLTDQSPSSINKLIRKGIAYGPEWRQHQREEKKAVQEKIKKRIAENKWKKEEKDIKSKERKLAAINALLGVPLATTKEQLDEIFNGPKATEKLKDQIRFRSIVKEENITLSGSKQILYDKLLKHITANGESSMSNTEN